MRLLALLFFLVPFHLAAGTLAYRLLRSPLQPLGGGVLVAQVSVSAAFPYRKLLTKK